MEPEQLAQVLKVSRCPSGCLWSAGPSPPKAEPMSQDEGEKYQALGLQLCSRHPGPQRAPTCQALPVPQHLSSHHPPNQS